MITTSMPNTENAGRIRALDGARGVAILIVVLYHAMIFESIETLFESILYGPLRIGWSGVDLFFVLSGFLITRILLRERESPNYFRTFYGRRILRIFPLYYAFLVALLIVVPQIVEPNAGFVFWARGAPRESLWYWLFLSNLNDAMAGQFHHNFLAISWSLAIEEQFYLFWPLLVWKLSIRKLAWLCGIMIGVALASRIGFTLAGAPPLSLYIATPFRMDTLAVGAAIALIAQSPSGIARLASLSRPGLPIAFVLFAAFAAIFIACPTFMGAPEGRTLLANPYMQTVGYSISAAFYGVLVASLIALPESFVARAFESSALVLFGRYSYAIYLFHTPINWASKRFLFNPRQYDWPFVVEQTIHHAIVIGLSLGVAWISWRLIERPAQRLRRYFP